jgi:hypothetical protein
MTLLELITKSYWDAFYTGMMSVGLRPEQRPKWSGTTATERETIRCMRHSLEILRTPTPAMLAAAGPDPDAAAAIWQAMFDAEFADKPTKRGAVMTDNDLTIRDRAGAIFANDPGDAELRHVSDLLNLDPDLFPGNRNLCLVIWEKAKEQAEAEGDETEAGMEAKLRALVARLNGTA